MNVRPSRNIRSHRGQRASHHVALFCGPSATPGHRQAPGLGGPTGCHPKSPPSMDGGFRRRSAAGSGVSTPFLASQHAPPVGRAHVELGLLERQMPAPGGELMHGGPGLRPGDQPRLAEPTGRLPLDACQARARRPSSPAPCAIGAGRAPSAGAPTPRDGAASSAACSIARPPSRPRANAGRAHVQGAWASASVLDWRHLGSPSGSAIRGPDLTASPIRHPVQADTSNASRRGCSTGQRARKAASSARDQAGKPSVFGGGRRARAGAGVVREHVSLDGRRAKEPPSRSARTRPRAGEPRRVPLDVVSRKATKRAWPQSAQIAARWRCGTRR